MRLVGLIHGLAALTCVYAATHISITSTAEPVQSSTGLDSCPLTSMAPMCTGEATVDGTVTQLTYICPAKTSRSTVTVTVTKTKTCTPTVTSVVTDDLAAKTSEAEPTTTVTIAKISTVEKTLTVHRASKSSTIVVSSSGTSASSVVVTPTSGSTSIASDEQATTITLHSTFTVIKTVTARPANETTLFPTLTATTNGTTKGIFFTRSVCNSSFAGPTATATFHLGASTTDTIHNSTSTNPAKRVAQLQSVTYETTPTAAYPGAVTKAMGGTGEATGNNQVSFLALFGGLMAATFLL